jgi:hypothetical protein
VTWNPVRVTKLLDEDGKPRLSNEMTQIQLCPWFVDWVKDRKIKLHKDAVKSIVGKAIIRATESSSNYLGFAQIGIHRYSGNEEYANTSVDAFSLLDKVLLHEMTHARATFSGRDKNKDYQEGLIDAPAMKGWLSLRLFDWSAYGWKLTRALAMYGDPLGGVNAPDNNSDTIAMFGSSEYSN